MPAYHLPSINKIAEALGGDVVNREALVPGPGHSAEDRSLSIKLDSAAPDRFVVHSFAGDDPIACRDHVRQKLGLPKFERKKNGGNKVSKAWTQISEHIYRDQNGAPYLRVRKLIDESGKKQYPQAHWDGKQWINRKPKGPKLPYNLPALIAASVTATIWFCEGEKDADALIKQSFVATTASEGAAAFWDPALTQYFRDRTVVILPDADKPGRAHSQKVAKAINSVAASVRVLDLYPDRNDGSDVSIGLVRDFGREGQWQDDAAQSHQLPGKTRIGERVHQRARALSQYYEMVALFGHRRGGHSPRRKRRLESSHQ
jgi:hypothetical protein